MGYNFFFQIQELFLQSVLFTPEACEWDPPLFTSEASLILMENPAERYPSVVGGLPPQEHHQPCGSKLRNLRLAGPGCWRRQSWLAGVSPWFRTRFLRTCLVLTPSFYCSDASQRTRVPLTGLPSLETSSPGALTL